MWNLLVHTTVFLECICLARVCCTGACLADCLPLSPVPVHYRQALPRVDNFVGIYCVHPRSAYIVLSVLCLQQQMSRSSLLLFHSSCAVAISGCKLHALAFGCSYVLLRVFCFAADVLAVFAEHSSTQHVLRPDACSQTQDITLAWACAAHQLSAWAASAVCCLCQCVGCMDLVAAA